MFYLPFPYAYDNQGSVTYDFVAGSNGRVPAHDPITRSGGIPDCQFDVSEVIGEFQVTRVRCSICIVQFVGVLLAPALVLAETGPGSEKDKMVERQWGKAFKGLAVSIASERSSYGPGERIVLSVLLKNSGQKDTRVATPAPLAIFRPTVQLPDGKESPLTLRGRMLTESAREGGVGGVILAPGKALRVDLVLDRLYDFSLSGKYAISVCAVLFGQDTTIASNKLEITVNTSLDNHEAEYIWDRTNTPAKSATRAKASQHSALIRPVSGK